MVSRILMALAGFGIVLILIRTFAGFGGVAAPAQAAAFFPASEQESAFIAVSNDSQGGRHAAFTGYDGPTKDQIFYATCSSGDCGANPDGWERATIPFPGAHKVQLALTADGRPRLHVTAYAPPERTDYNRTYSYGECDSGCTDAANWRFVEVGASGDNLIGEVLALRTPVRSFALDDKDRPRFLYTDANYIIEPDHYGAFVMACDVGCTDKANWTETNLGLKSGYVTEQFTKPALAIGKDGTIAVAANVYAFDETGAKMKDGLYYYSCKDACTERASWSRAFVNEIGGGSYPSPGWDLALTADGRPRIAQFLGDGTERRDLAHELIYLWCNTDCTKDDSWAGSALGAGNGIGESPDLVLDDQDRPRIAMIAKGGNAALAACDTDCETNTPKWRFSIAEPIEAVRAARPKALPFHCDGEVWEALMPTLALDGDQATVGYDLLVSARCLYKYFQEPEPVATFHEIFHGTRIATVKLPE